MDKTLKLHTRRKERIRHKIRTLRHSGMDRPRLAIHRSEKNIYAQIVDDEKGTTLATASTLDKEIKGKMKSGANVEAAKAVGALVAARAIKAGVKEVIFDRGGYLYHGRVKALADAAREAGLAF